MPKTGAFEHSISLVNLVLPDSITKIFGEPFSGCEALARIAMPETDKAFPLWVHLAERGYADRVQFL